MLSRRWWALSRNALVLVIVCGLAGCAVGPDYKRPPVPVPADWRSPAEGAGSLANLDWWQLFQDPVLQDLIRTALEENKDLQMTVARVAEARAQLGFTRSAQFPQVAGEASYSNQRFSRKGFPLSALPPNQSLNPETEFYRTNLDLSFELDLWGRLRRATEAARADLLASDENRRTVLTTLVSDVAQTYFDLLELDWELDIARRTLTSRQASLDLVERVATVADRNGQPEAPPKPAQPARPAANARPWYRRPLVLALAGTVALVMLIVGVPYVRHAMTHESTDDAFIDAHVVTVSPKVASYVARVHIDDNWHVNAGDLLVELDPRDFETRRAQARADLAAAVAQQQSAAINVRVVDTTSGAGVRQAESGVQAAQRQLDGARSRLDQARAQVAAARAEATRAAADVQRYERLLQYGGVSRQERDNAVAVNRTAVANLVAARQAEQAAADALRQQEAQLGQAHAQLASANAAPDQVAYSRVQVQQAAAQIAQREAAVRQAELYLSYTKIYAPESGRITRKSVEPGDYVQVGQTLFSIVPDYLWVVANFKETQLSDSRPGQPATIHVDAYRDNPFKGHVDSIQAGPGAAFSLLPPENATGNYVKVVQRVPVKILIDEPPDPNHVLGPGMSVVPEVKIR